jgi:chemotaxis methyl-accepting protein methylase
MGLASTRAVWLQAAADRMSQSRRLRRYLGRPYLRVNMWIWNHLPASLTSLRVGWTYGAHLHRLIQLRSARRQYLGTFFFRNRPELELLIRLLDPKRQESTLDLSILGCSKGAEVYSFSYSIRCARPDLKVRLRALDIDPDVLEFAEEGVYSLKSRVPEQKSSSGSLVPGGDLASKTFGDQRTSVFERMSSDEIEAMFECEGERARVKPQFREGITWHLGDAGDPKLVDVFGLQDIVVANRFLCHMEPEEAETCLRNLARLVKPGGYLFVSGIDLGVRSKVARELRWMPLTELISEIHEGDPSLRQDWPLEYWGLEPFDRRRNHWGIRYASVFQLGVAFPAITPNETL